MTFKSYHTDPQYDAAIAEELTEHMAPRFSQMREWLSDTFMMNEDEVQRALHEPYETMQYKLGEIVNDGLRNDTQKDLRRIIGIRIRPMNFGPNPADIVPTGPNDKALMIRIMSELTIAGGETREQARERVMLLVNEMVGTRAKEAGENVVKSFFG